MKKTKLIIPTTPFKQFLKGVVKMVNTALFVVKDYKITVFTERENGIMLLLSELSLPIEESNNVDLEIPVLEVDKLIKLVEFNKEENIELIIEKNYLKYVGESTKVKLHLGEPSIINLPENITVDKFKQLKTEFSTVIPKDKLAQLDKGYNFIKRVSDNIKVYFYIENDKFCVELTDYTSNNVDSFKLVLSDEYVGDLEGEKIPISYKNWCLLDLAADNIVFEAIFVSNKRYKAKIPVFKQHLSNLEITHLIKNLDK